MDHLSLLAGLACATGVQETSFHSPGAGCQSGEETGAMQKKDEKAGEESGRVSPEVLPRSSSAKARTLCEHFRSSPKAKRIGQDPQKSR